MLSAKNVVKPGYSVFIRQTTSAGVVWILTTLSHSLYIELYLQIIFICVRLNWLDIHECHTMPLKESPSWSYACNKNADKAAFILKSIKLFILTSGQTLAL